MLAALFETSLRPSASCISGGESTEAKTLSRVQVGEIQLTLTQGSIFGSGSAHQPWSAALHAAIAKAVD